MHTPISKPLNFPTPIPQGFYRANRARLLGLLQSSPKIKLPGLLFLKGPVEIPRHDDDSSLCINPEPFFLYLFGITDPDTYAMLDLKSGKATVFVRLPDPSEAFWSKSRSLEEFKARYEIDDARSVDELEAFLQAYGDKSSFTVYLNYGQSVYSKAYSATPREEFAALLAKFTVDDSTIYEYDCECRVFKSAQELAVLGDSIALANLAHRTVMRSVLPGITEKEVSNLFTSVRELYGASIAYGNIVCAGHNGSFLHYEPSDRVLFKDNDLLLIDSACKLSGYCSDITRTFPVSGRYTQRQKDIYNIVLDAQTQSFAAAKPGVLFQDLHIIAEKTILAGLLRLGLIQGEVEQAWKNRAIWYFMPHGLGHYIGLYCHDLPGLREKENNWVPYPKMGVPIKRILEKGMVFTIEPGIYFNDVLLEQGFNDPDAAPFLVKTVIEEYKKEVGGVRIEDMYTITDTGCQLMSGDLIKTVEEIEAFMQNK